MTPDCQHRNGVLEQKSCISRPFNEIGRLSYSAGHMSSAARVGDRIREWRLRRRLTQDELGEKIGSDGSRVGRLEKGTENPTLETLDKLAGALKVDVAEFFVARPGESTGHATERSGSNLGVLETLLASVDAESPAEDSWRGDVLKAVATLNRALRRPDAGAGSEPGDRKVARPRR